MLPQLRLMNSFLEVNVVFFHLPSVDMLALNGRRVVAKGSLPSLLSSTTSFQLGALSRRHHHAQYGELYCDWQHCGLFQSLILRLAPLSAHCSYSS